MDELALNNINTGSETKAKRKKWLKKGVKRFAVTYLIVVELLCCANCMAWIFNDSEARVLNNIFKNISSQTYSVAPVSFVAAIPVFAEDAYDAYIEENRYKGPVLTRGRGTITGPSGKETYYNLNMAGVVKIMRRMGNNDEYWVRDDGVKMLGDYVMVAANLNLRPRGSLVETSLGTGIVCDTGGFAKRNPTQLDIATAW